MEIENLKKEKQSLTWSTKVKKFGGEIDREYQILNHGDHLSINCNIVADGDIKRTELVHLPLTLIDELKNIEICED